MLFSILVLFAYCGENDSIANNVQNAPGTFKLMMYDSSLGAASTGATSTSAASTTNNHEDDDNDDHDDENEIHPLPAGIEEVNDEVKKITLITAANTRVLLFEGSGVFDLLALTPDNPYILANNVIPPGKYKAIEFELAKLGNSKINGVKYYIEIEHHIVTVVLSFETNVTDFFSVTADFNLAQSIEFEDDFGKTESKDHHDDEDHKEDEDEIHVDNDDDHTGHEIETIAELEPKITIIATSLFL